MKQVHFRFIHHSNMKLIETVSIKWTSQTISGCKLCTKKQNRACSSSIMLRTAVTSAFSSSWHLLPTLSRIWSSFWRASNRPASHTECIHCYSPHFHLKFNSTVSLHYFLLVISLWVQRNSSYLTEMKYPQWPAVTLTFDLLTQRQPQAQFLPGLHMIK